VVTVGSRCVFRDSNILPHPSSGTDICIADRYRRLVVLSGSFSQRRILKRTPPNASLLKMWYPLENTHSLQQFAVTQVPTGLLSPFAFRPIAPKPAPAPAPALPTGRVLYSQGSQVAQTPVLGSGPPPCVLGSQGQKGILPCSPDDAAAPAAGTNPIVQKDADGKFPCSYCGKTFMQAKHLKRHFLSRKSPFPSSVIVLDITKQFSRRHWRAAV
jgi:hypothetical protein